MQHPCDGKAWKYFDNVYLEFAADSLHVRLGLCSNGFTPYVQALASPYSCWPIFLTPYNLPPMYDQTVNVTNLTNLSDTWSDKPKKENRSVLAATY